MCRISGPQVHLPMISGSRSDATRIPYPLTPSLATADGPLSPVGICPVWSAMCLSRAVFLPARLYEEMFSRARPVANGCSTDRYGLTAPGRAGEEEANRSRSPRMTLQNDQPLHGISLAAFMVGLKYYTPRMLCILSRMVRCLIINTRLADAVI